MNLPATFHQSGLHSDALLEIEHLIVGCGGFVRELIRHTAGACSLKDGGQRVSAADGLVDRLLREQLQRLVPDSSGYSEESGYFGTPSGPLQVRWLIDPVDGTRPATLGGAFAISVGALVMRDEVPIASVGWVFVPTLAVMYRGVVATGFSECRLNGQAVKSPEPVFESDLQLQYIVVGSDWERIRLTHCPLKLSAQGATAVHLTQLVHPGSDVAAVVLSRYFPHDIAGGLVSAVAGGSALHRIENGEVSADAEDPLLFLAMRYSTPEKPGPPMLVCSPVVAECLR